MAQAIINSAYPLRLQMADGNAVVYVRGQVFSPAGASLGFVTLPHITDGLYGTNYTFVALGNHIVVYRIYLDPGFLTPAQYDREITEVYVSRSIPADVWDALVTSHLGAGTLGEAMALVRGLVQNNYVLDNTTYNAKGLLTGGRIRIFKDSADTLAEVLPIATFTIAGTPELAPNDHLGQKMVVTKDP